MSGILGRMQPCEGRPARVGRRWLFLRERIAAAIAPLDDPATWRSQRDTDRL
jgi:hypothetical protein